MSSALIVVEILKLGVTALELSQAGDDEAVRQIFRQISSRCVAANAAWEDAAKPGDDVGD